MTKYPHAMIRVTDPEATTRFFELSGMNVVRRMERTNGPLHAHCVMAGGGACRGLGKDGWCSSSGLRHSYWEGAMCSPKTRTYT